MKINNKTVGDYGYIAIYNNHQPVKVYAPSEKVAQKVAAQHFGIKKSYNVSVYLSEDTKGYQILTFN